MKLQSIINSAEDAFRFAYDSNDNAIKNLLRRTDFDSIKKWFLVKDKYGSTPLDVLKQRAIITAEQLVKITNDKNNIGYIVYLITTGRDNKKLISIMNDVLSNNGISTIKRKIGCGASGCAYLSHNETVLKFTTSNNEQKFAMVLKEEKLKTFPKIHRVINLMFDGDHAAYVIESEFIPNDLSDKQKVVIDFYNFFIRNKSLNTDKLINDFKINHQEEYDESFLNEAMDDAKIFINNLKNDLKQIGLSNRFYGDAHYDNFKSKNGSIFLVDLGQGYNKNSHQKIESFSIK